VEEDEQGQKDDESEFENNDNDDDDDDDEEEEEEEEEEEPLPSLILTAHNETICVVQGGAPGLGNDTVASGKGRKNSKSMPASNLPGGPGQARTLVLEAQIIADVGLIGYPNAGKSTLLRALSNARPKVGPYPFTTLKPSVGVVEFSDSGRITVTDIPGIIKGAHLNRGLGHSFLKHVAKTKMLLFVVDVASINATSTSSSSSTSSTSTTTPSEAAAAGRRRGSKAAAVAAAAAADRIRGPVQDLRNLIEEIALYDGELLDKPRMVFANKVDLKTSKRTLSALEELAGSFDMKVQACCFAQYL